MENNPRNLIRIRLKPDENLRNPFRNHGQIRKNPFTYGENYFKSFHQIESPKKTDAKKQQLKTSLEPD